MDALEESKASCGIQDARPLGLTLLNSLQSTTKLCSGGLEQLILQRVLFMHQCNEVTVESDLQHLGSSSAESAALHLFNTIQFIITVEMDQTH